MGLRARSRRGAPMQVLAMAGVLVAAIVAAALLQRHHPTTAPTSGVSAQPTASVNATSLPAVPAADLVAANLTGPSALVTPFQMVAGDGTAETLIGAYADATRIVLFLRSPSVGASVGASPSPGPPAIMRMSVYDSQGFLNGGTMGGRGIPGDSFFALDLGPRLDQDGLAHLTVTDNIRFDSVTTGPPSTGWTFRLTLKVQATTVLPAPATFKLGSWKVTIDNLALTPSVIDFQAVVAGANLEQLNMQPGGPDLQPVALINAAGNAVSPIWASGSATVSKWLLNPTNNPRVHYQWARPATAATYRLRVSGNGATQTITLQIPGA